MSNNVLQTVFKLLIRLPMRNLSILFILLITFFKTNAQGNLQFNTSKFIEITASIYNPNVPPYFYKDSVITVPPGKIWKIESTSATYSCNTNAVSLFLDGRIICGNTSYGTFPIWLSEGHYTLLLHSNTNNQNKAAINLIEFNIIP